jgi:hypothetical protein
VTRRKAVEAVEDEDVPAECHLCGAATPTFQDPEDEDGLAVFDLCGRCNVTFRDLARALEAAQDARSARLEAVAQVEGQLELDDLEPPFCEACNEDLGVLEDEAGRVIRVLPCGPCAVRTALVTGDWTNVPTGAAGDMLRRPGLLPADYEALRALLARRS